MEMHGTFMGLFHCGSKNIGKIIFVVRMTFTHFYYNKRMKENGRKKDV